MNPPEISTNPDRHVGRISPVHKLALCYECSLFEEDGEGVHLALWPCKVARQGRRRGSRVGVAA